MGIDGRVTRLEQQYQDLKRQLRAYTSITDSLAYQVNTLAWESIIARLQAAAQQTLTDTPPHTPASFDETESTSSTAAIPEPETGLERWPVGSLEGDSVLIAFDYHPSTLKVHSIYYRNTSGLNVRVGVQTPQETSHRWWTLGPTSPDGVLVDIPNAIRFHRDDISVILQFEQA